MAIAKLFALHTNTINIFDERYLKLIFPNHISSKYQLF